MRLISMDKVLFDHALHENLYSANGLLLFARGMKMNSDVIDRMTERGYDRIYVDDAATQDINPEPLMSDGLQIDVFKLMLKIKQQLAPFNDPEKAPLINIDEVIHMAGVIVDEIVNVGRARAVDRLFIKPPESYFAGHSMAVAALATSLGARMGLAKAKLQALALGALLHNIGECFMPDQMFEKQAKFNDKELLLMQQHTTQGFRYLTRYDALPPTARAVAIQHHERFCGRGYPKGLSGDNIHLYAQLVGAADVYDAATTKRPHRPALAPLLAISLLLSAKDPYFSAEVRELISKRMAPFPVGTWVKLSNNTEGIVSEVPSQTVARPNVKIIYGPNRQSAQLQVVHLAAQPELRVVGIPQDL